MRVLVATMDYPPIEGGISMLTQRLVRELSAQGHDVTVLAPALSPSNPQYSDTRAHDEAHGARIVRVGGYERGWLRVLPFLRAGLPLARETDCVLAMNIAYGGPLGWLARRRYGTPYLTFAYAYEFLKYRIWPGAGPLLRRCYAGSLGTVAISEFTRRELVNFGVPASRIRVVYPGVDPPAPRDEARIAAWRARLDLKGRLILCVGRFMLRKGQFQLIDAMPHIREHAPDTQLVLVGRGPTYDACLARVRTLNLEEVVHAPGYLKPEDLAALYHLCDVFALPSGEARAGQIEGFGLVFLEANAYAKPVVGGRTGGVVEAVLDGKTGLLVRPDDVALLAETLTRLLAEPERALAMGRAGQERALGEFTWTRFAEGVAAMMPGPRA